jgi:prepilin-type N-terminal cleavage/methylation domain-containing protein
MAGDRARTAFTLIELLVVVAIIALLISILLPSLAMARETAKAAVCAHNVRQVTLAGSMWLSDTRRQRAPAHRGWAAFVMEMTSGVKKPFTCPTDTKPIPVPGVYVSQIGVGRAQGGKDLIYPSVSIDGGYFWRPNTANSSGFYRADMETDVEKQAGGDKDFNDASVYYKPDGPQADQGDVYATLGSTGRLLKLHTWRGKTIAVISGTTARSR